MRRSTADPILTENVAKPLYLATLLINSWFLDGGSNPWEPGIFAKNKHA